MKLRCATILNLAAILAGQLASQGQAISPSGLFNTNTLSGIAFDPSGAPAEGVVLEVIQAAPPTVKEGLAGAGGAFTISWGSHRRGPGASPPLADSLLAARDVTHGFASVMKIDETMTTSICICKKDSFSQARWRTAAAQG